MSNLEIQPARRAPKPLPGNLKSVQPGGGYCYQIELAWGRLRRWYLNRFRRGYVRRMSEKRHGDPAGAPHEIVDPRDLKFVRNQCTADWAPEDDPFRWREAIPFARWGLAELQLMGYPLLAISIALVVLGFWYLALPIAVVLVLIVYFFRDPPRRVPQEAGLMVAPCDGTVAEITRLEHDDYIGGPAVRIGIFLSIFNVHINRSPARARAIEFRYSPGEFLNALNPESLIRNENLWIGMQAEDPPYRPLIVRQIAGLIARRIVCQLRPGEVVERGAKFGMIKLGSRTELLMPDEPGLEVLVGVGQQVKGGATVVARYKT
jgi:phosphatidylserine decarboxylase